MKPTPTSNLVKNLLSDNTRQSFGELLDRTGITAPYLQKILTALVIDGTLQTERTSTVTHYWLTAASDLVPQI